MADLQLSASLIGGKGLVDLQYVINNLGIDLASNKYTAGVIELTTTPEAIPMGEVVNPGICYFRNMATVEEGTGEDIQVGKEVSAVFEEFQEYGPEDFQIGRLPASVTAPFAVAVANTARLEFLIFER